MQWARPVTHVAGDVAKCSGGFGRFLPRGGVEMTLKRGKDGNEQVDVVDAQTHLQTDSKEILYTRQLKNIYTYISCNAFKFDALLLVAGNSIRM